MGSRDMYSSRIEMLGKLTCDLKECLNKRDGSSYKTTFFGHLGPIIDLDEKRFHIKCLERKKMQQSITDIGKKAID
jgi:hypothetical protein